MKTPLFVLLFCCFYILPTLGQGESKVDRSTLRFQPTMRTNAELSDFAYGKNRVVHEELSVDESKEVFLGPPAGGLKFYAAIKALKELIKDHVVIVRIPTKGVFDAMKPRFAEIQDLNWLIFSVVIAAGPQGANPVLQPDVIKEMVDEWPLPIKVLYELTLGHDMEQGMPLGYSQDMLVTFSAIFMTAGLDRLKDFLIVVDAMHISRTDAIVINALKDKLLRQVIACVVYATEDSYKNVDMDGFKNFVKATAMEDLYFNTPDAFRRANGIVDAGTPGGGGGTPQKPGQPSKGRKAATEGRGFVVLAGILFLANWN